jgi:hypothetical protein
MTEKGQMVTISVVNMVAIFLASCRRQRQPLLQTLSGTTSDSSVKKDNLTILSSSIPAQTTQKAYVYRIKMYIEILSKPKEELSL